MGLIKRITHQFETNDLEYEFTPSFETFGACKDTWTATGTNYTTIEAHGSNGVSIVFSDDFMTSGVSVWKIWSDDLADMYYEIVLYSKDNSETYENDEILDRRTIELKRIEVIDEKGEKLEDITDNYYEISNSTSAFTLSYNYCLVTKNNSNLIFEDGIEHKFVYVGKSDKFNTWLSGINENIKNEYKQKNKKEDGSELDDADIPNDIYEKDTIKNRIRYEFKSIKGFYYLTYPSSSFTLNTSYDCYKGESLDYIDNIEAQFFNTASVSNRNNLGFYADDSKTNIMLPNTANTSGVTTLEMNMNTQFTINSNEGYEEDIDNIFRLTFDDNYDYFYELKITQLGFKKEAFLSANTYSIILDYDKDKSYTLEVIDWELISKVGDNDMYEKHELSSDEEIVIDNTNWLSYTSKYDEKTGINKITFATKTSNETESPRYTYVLLKSSYSGIVKKVYVCQKIKNNKETKLIVGFLEDGSNDFKTKFINANITINVGSVGETRTYDLNDETKCVLISGCVLNDTYSIKINDITYNDDNGGKFYLKNNTENEPLNVTSFCNLKIPLDDKGGITKDELDNNSDINKYLNKEGKITVDGLKYTSFNGTYSNTQITKPFGINGRLKYVKSDDNDNKDYQIFCYLITRGDKNNDDE